MAKVIELQHQILMAIKGVTVPQIRIYWSKPYEDTFNGRKD